MLSLLLGFASLCALGRAVPLLNATDSLDVRQSSSQYTYVDLSVNTGTPLHRASGVLYGVPITSGQIPSSFYTGMGFNYQSSGGAQDPNHSGWIYGGYTGRFQGVLSNYKTTKQYGGQFMLKMSDLWGADGGTANMWPGDNGDYTEYDRFLTQLVKDIKANSMTDVKLLIWNEPDLSAFWTQGIDRYLATWSHTVKFLRSNLSGTKIAGPAMANQPVSSNTWWTRWLTEIKSSSTAPDVYTWHHETGKSNSLNDLSVTQPNMVNLLNSYGLTIGEFVIDEYGVASEQVPGGAAWWISSFERWNMYGLRGNWASGWALHDYLANLLGKSDTNSASATGYYANGEYQVYKYYASSMSGYRVQTTRSTDKLMDSYAVVSSSDRTVRILVGGRQVTGTYELQINNLGALGLASSGTISVRTREFPWGGIYGKVDAPTDLGLFSHTYSGNTLSFPIYQTDTSKTWAFEFAY